MIQRVQHTATEIIEAMREERGFSAECAKTYRCHWRMLGQFSGSSDVCVSDETCGRFLSYLEQQGKARYYVRSVRASLLAVRNAASDYGLCERPKIRAVKVPELHPQAWSREEVQTLVKTARELSGTVNTRQAGEWWSTAIQGAWHLGVRLTDQLAIKRCQFDQDGVARFNQHKTGRLIVCSLPLTLLDSIPSRGRLWPWPHSYEHFRRVFAGIVKNAEIRRGPWKQIRKSAGNEAERLRPGQGHLFLGNERRTFERHYQVRSMHPAVMLAALK